MPGGSCPSPVPPRPLSPSPKKELNGGLERGLVLLVLILTVLCGLILLLLIRASHMEAYIAQRQSELKDTTSIPSIFESTIARTGRGERHGENSSFRTTELCLSPECIYASSSILRSIDPSVDPCQDFYQFACGRWPIHHPLRPDTSNLDTLTLLKNDMRQVFKELLEAPMTKDDSSSTTQAKLLYKSCMNETTAERLREKPLLSLLERLGLRWPLVDPLQYTTENELNNTSSESPYISLPTSNKRRSLPDRSLNENFLNTFDWHRSLGYLRQMKLETFFMIFSQADQQNSSATILQIDQNEPSVPYVDLNSARGRRQIKAYHTTMVLAAELLGANRTQAVVDMKDVVIFELRMRTFMEPSEERRNFTAINHRMTLGQLDAFVPHLRIRKLSSVVFQKQFDPDERLVVYAPNYLKKLNELLKSTPKKTVANYMGWRVVYTLMNFMDKRFVTLRQRYANILAGTSHPIPRWRLCVTLVNLNLGMVTGAMFVTNHYTAFMKSSAESMIRDIRTAFLKQLDDLDWMDSKTKAAARHKAISMRYKVAYPEEILDQNWLDKEHQLNFSADDVFTNILLVSRFRYSKELERFGKPNDLKRWIMNPGTVNAFYTRTGNFITLPAAILQPPMFHPSYPAAKNYGGIGVVIGHEITHGFDDKGRQFNGLGNLAQWWQPEALRKFSDKARCMVEQYSSYKVHEVDMKVNGFKTQGENIADNGGLKQAYARQCDAAGRNVVNATRFEVIRRYRLVGVTRVCTASCSSE
ncbi:endothelin-converting enzyme 1-like isoform X2 [Varroa jacobsoni]|uniref:endothelin-converting enzyme 1-like isoform X2 n=1 Tax=Varroa jacobsoni TaxID=62625 RepID=UPI000BF2BD89|nr:endothelin-converting enzyme 1-like isoform X2 [Varroa jacobsoni]